MILKVIIFGVKMILFIVFYMLVRWTIPRFRYDQLMGLAWKVMIPLTLINFVMVLFIRHYRPLGDYSDWLMLPISVAVFVAAAVVSLSLPRGPMRAEIVGTGHPVTGGSRILTKH